MSIFTHTLVFILGGMVGIAAMACLIVGGGHD